jgi:hypothetical protein
MTLCIFIHSRSKRAEAVALLDSGAMENFLNIKYASKIGLLVKRLTMERKLFNVDSMPNKAGTLKYYADLETCTGAKRTTLRFFLTNLGENQVILGYPWFVTAQPQIDWARGWIDYDQLPIIIRNNDTHQAAFHTRNQGQKVVIKKVKVDERVPPPYRHFADVFSNKESKKFPPSQP